MQQKKKADLRRMLNELHDGLELLKETQSTKESQMCTIMSNEKLEQVFQYSLIKKFRLSLILFMATCKAKNISEDDQELYSEIIKSRKISEQAYTEELVHALCTQIPGYYALMQKYAEKL